MQVGNLRLRPYQERFVDDIRGALRRNARIVAQLPTGGGKTAIGLYIMHSAVNLGNRAMFIVHQRELLAQTEAAFWKQGLPHGVIASGRKTSRLPAQLAMVQTLINRIEKGAVDPPDLIIIDEAHRSLAPSYKKVVEAFPRAKVIGLTATPDRTDGQPLRYLYEDLVTGPTINELIELGHLCRYELYSPSIRGASADGVGRRGGDYDQAQLAQLFEKRQIYGDAIDHYQRLTPGKRAVVMCAGVKNAHGAAEEFRRAGVPAACIEGSMTSTEREGIIKDLTSGKLRVVTNMNLLIEGVDIPAIEVVQWLRPTMSTIVWMQGNGRGFRPSPGKEKLIILDHVANHVQHGAPCEDREWSLDGASRAKRSKSDDVVDVPAPSLASCDSCFRTYEFHLEACPFCGEPNSAKKQRELKIIEGELERINVEKVKEARRNARRRQGQAQDIRSLVRLFASQGSKSPDKRAAFVYASRDGGRKPRPEEYKEAADALRELRNIGRVRSIEW